jgi:hypothetical protein
LELKGVSKMQWDAELLDKKFAFDFWKGSAILQAEVKEKTFGPLTFVGGYVDYGSISYDRKELEFEAPAYGYIILKPEKVDL